MNDLFLALCISYQTIRSWRRTGLMPCSVCQGGQVLVFVDGNKVVGDLEQCMVLMAASLLDWSDGHCTNVVGLELEALLTPRWIESWSNECDQRNTKEPYFYDKISMLGPDFDLKQWFQSIFSE